MTAGSNSGGSAVEIVMIKPWMKRLAPLAVGGTTLGVFQSFADIDYNQLLFQFLATWLSALVTLLFGGDPSQYFNA